MEFIAGAEFNRLWSARASKSCARRSCNWRWILSSRMVTQLMARKSRPTSWMLQSVNVFLLTSHYGQECILENSMTPLGFLGCVKYVDVARSRPGCLPFSLGPLTLLRIHSEWVKFLDHTDTNLHVSQFNWEPTGMGERYDCTSVDVHHTWTYIALTQTPLPTMTPTTMVVFACAWTDGAAECVEHRTAACEHRGELAPAHTPRINV